MFTKELYKKIGGFDETFTVAGDYDWCVRAAKQSTFARATSIGGIFTNDGTTLSGSRSARHKAENARIEKTISS